MNKIISRLMLASATIALGAALTPMAATAADFFNDNSPDIYNGNLVLGNAQGDADTYTITGNSAVTSVNFADPKLPGQPNGALIVGNAGLGSFTQGTSPEVDGGNYVNVDGDLAIGHMPTGQGTYTLNSGLLQVGGQLSVGGQSQADNVFNQFAGSVILTNSANTSGEEGGVNPLYESVPAGSSAFGGKLTIGGGLNDNGGNEGGNGTYNLYGGSINTVANGIEVGATGTGIMNQFGGDVKTTFLTEGFQGNGTYNLYDGTINAYSSAVGFAGTGAFNQYGGAVTIGLNEDGSLRDTSGQAALTIGAHCCDNTLGSGIYTMSGGELHTGNMVVGDGEQGSFIETTPIASRDPLVEVTGSLIVGGAQDGSIGSYAITGFDSFLDVKFAPGGNGNDGTNGTYDVFDPDTNTHTAVSRGNPNGALIIAQGLADGSATVSGTFTQSADSHVNVAGDVVLGQNQNATGSYTIDSGDLTVGGKLLVGNSGIGTFNQSGGAVTVTGTAYGNPDYAAIGNSSYNGQFDGAGIAFIGGSWGSSNGTGTYTMTGGTLDAGGLEVGFTAAGEMKQSGGVVTAQFLSMGGCGGCNGRNSVGLYRLSGDGQLNVTFSGEQIGAFGHAEFYQTGGTNSVIGGLNIGDAPSLYTDHNGIRYGEPGYTPNPDDSIQPDRSGYYELSGGILKTDTTVVGSSGLGRFVQSGGEHDITGYLFIGRDFTPIERGCGDTSPADTTTCGVGGPAHGTYTMEGGELTANNGVVGDAGIGHLDISGGSTVHFLSNPETETPGGNVTIARRLGSTGSSMTISNAGEASPSVTIDGYLTVGDSDAGSLTISGGSLTVGQGLNVGIFGNEGPGTGLFTQSGGTVTVSNGMAIGGGTGEYDLSGGTLNATGTEYVGAYSGTGTFKQTGGTFNGDYLDVGILNGGTGSYSISDGLLNLTGNLGLGGPNAGGTFAQTGGAVQAGGLYINNNGTYGISSGTLDVAGTIFLSDNSGTNAKFNQSGGTVTAAGLVIGNLQGTGGTYDLTGGTLNDSATIGDAGTGTFDNTGATHNVTGDLTLGNQSTGDGTYNLTAGGTTTVSGFTFVGGDGKGTFTNDASTHDTLKLVVGNGAGSTGTYTVQNGGALNVGSAGPGNEGFADIGGRSTAGGKLIQNGATSATTIYGALDVGRFAGATGQVDLNAGKMTVNGFAVVGDSGTGTFNQGGASTMDVVGGGLFVGRGQSNENGNAVITGTGTYNLSDTAALTVTGGITLGQLAGTTGTFKQTGGTIIADNETIGLAGVGHWSQSGGTNTVSGAVIVNNSGAVNGSSLTVSGGSLKAASVTNNDQFTMTGGTVTSAVQNNKQFDLNGGSVVGSVTNDASMKTSGGTTATITGPLTNNGTAGVSNNSTLVVDGTVTNTGTVAVDAGSKLDASGHTYTQTGGVTQVDGQVAANLAQIVLGTLQGNGTITGNVSNVGGKVRGGNNGTPGTLSVTGTYDQQITAAFETTIAGTAPTQVGRLNVTGSATLSGALNVVTDSFTFALGQLFNIMNFASSTGDFTSFSLNGNACSVYAVDAWSCAGLTNGLYIQEQFANGGTALNLLIAKMDEQTDVPEPLTISLFVAGIGGVTVIRRRRKAQKAD